MAHPPFIASRSHIFKKVTTGDYNALTSTTWANLDTTIDIAVKAAVGDDIEVFADGRWRPSGAGINTYVQVATWNGTALVNWLGSGEPTTTTGEGIPAWFMTGISNDQAMSGLWVYTVQAGDIVVDTNYGPQVTLRLRYRVTSGTQTLAASATTPFLWAARNIGPSYKSGA